VAVRRALPLAVAVAAHAAALGAIMAIRLPLPETASAPPEPAEIEIAAPERETMAPPASVLTPGEGHGAAGAKMRPLEPDSRKAPGPDEAAAPPEAAPDPRWSFSPLALAVDPRAALSPDLVSPRQNAEAPPPASVSATGGVAEGLAEHDAAIGMGRGGPVLSAVEDAARSSDAPVAGHATFEVVVGREGKVEARVLAAGGDAAAWRRVALAAAREVDPRRLRLPAGARGWRVVVDIEAKEQLADGRDIKTLHGLRASVAPSILQDAVEGRATPLATANPAAGPDTLPGDPTEPPPVGALGPSSSSNAGAAVLTGLAARVLPTPNLNFSGRVCSGAVALTPMGVSLSGGCSFENMVDRTRRRVVSGRIVSESEAAL
jgi:hypothetical protein